MASPWGFTIQPFPIESQCGDNYSLKKFFKILLELSYNLENLLRKVEVKDINPSFFKKYIGVVIPLTSTLVFLANNFFDKKIGIIS